MGTMTGTAGALPPAADALGLDIGSGLAGAGSPGRSRPRRRGLAAAALAAAALALGGCSTTGTGGASLASLSAPAPAAAPPPAAAPLPVPVNYGGFLGGTAGSRLSEADRKAALAAEDGAIATGERRSWKGGGGVYGYVVPGPASAAATAIPADGAPAECRSFTSTVFFGGRPTTGKGSGCRDLDGNWHVTS